MHQKQQQKGSAMNHCETLGEGDCLPNRTITRPLRDPSDSPNLPCFLRWQLSLLASL